MKRKSTIGLIINLVFLIVYYIIVIILLKHTPTDIDLCDEELN